MSSLAEILHRFSRTYEDGLREQLKLPDDWILKEIPWIKSELLDILFETIADEVHVVSSSERRDWPNGPHKRASFFISPKGRENMAAAIPLVQERAKPFLRQI